MNCVFISDTLNRLAPPKSRRMFFCHCTKTDLQTVHALAYKDPHEGARNKAKNTYYSTIIAKGQGNPRAIFLTFNKLLQSAQQYPLAASTKLWCDFYCWAITRYALQ